MQNACRLSFPSDRAILLVFPGTDGETHGGRLVQLRRHAPRLRGGDGGTLKDTLLTRGEGAEGEHPVGDVGDAVELTKFVARWVAIKHKVYNS